MRDFLRISPKDNVAVALTGLPAGYRINGDGLTLELNEAVNPGHKFALKHIAAGEKVIKYGFPIGEAKVSIAPGEHVHVHNLKTLLGSDLCYSYTPSGAAGLSEEALAGRKRVFMGYERPDGSAGVRNDIWIIPTVGCMNSCAREIESRCQALAGNGIDAVVALTHPYGCSQMGDDQENTREAISALIRHPNAGGVLVLGLGCENSNIGVLKEGYLKDCDLSRVRFLQGQDVTDEVEEGIRLVNTLVEEARRIRRTEISVEKLIVGLKCGGSDGFSGITANPAVGRFSDLLNAAGGSTILTEVPEMFGAETILMDRCENEEIFNKTVKLINGFKDYYRSHNQTIYENPSPGNKEGGISTLEDKALGCTQKSGFAPVVDVLAYAERVKKRGLNLLSAPGNDLVSSTALALSGAQIVLFTTGRGTPFAGVVPTVKISSNTPLNVHKNNWMDFNAGSLLEDGVRLEDIGAGLYDFVIGVAGGESVKSEAGYRDLAIFKQGVTL
ncbi:MAG: altronate dehydratase family protein [Lachnospiraceae bacterium]|nr:altronate dehydratase family protein [Lachnospiraceae bacterium]